MGIMKRLYHRSVGLSDNPYKQLFLDMGENIHIHYRDLRIELSAQEFLEFAEVFDHCAPLVRSKIEEGYQDGVLPNTNESNTLTTITQVKPLQHPVKYNTNRISIEDNVDGYHIHLRNYKLLFDKASFDNILQAMNDVVERRDSPHSLDELLHLIAYNDLEYSLLEASRDTAVKSALVEVDRKYFGKLCKVFKALNYSYTAENGGGVFRGENMEIRARIGSGKLTRMPAAIPPPPYVLLADYLTARKNELTSNEVNLLKLQVLNAFGMVRSGENPYINLNFRTFLVNPTDQMVIFQTITTRYEADTVKEYEAFSSFLYKLGQHFLKPTKIYFSQDENRRIWDVFEKHIEENIASHPCVNKIYMLGASKRSKMGQYEVPFIHFDWAKLASDFDILIELDEQYEIPDDWDRKFFWKTAGSYYAHLGDAPHRVDSPYLTQYPYVKFFHHLVEAYLFYPSSGDAQAKNKLLADSKAELIYSKEKNQKKKLSDTFDWVGGVAGLMRDCYGVLMPVVTEITLPSHNRVLKVEGSEAAFAVKIYHSSNFTPAKTGSQAKHIDYECAILRRLEQCDIPVITACPDKNSRYIHKIGSLSAMAFRFVDGEPFDGGVEQIACSAAILARLHGYLPLDAVAIRDFDYATDLAFWFARLDKMSGEPRYEECVANAGNFAEIALHVRKWLAQAQWQDLIWVHGHADVNPRNYIYANQSAFLFDFQAARIMPRLCDIADGMIEFGIDGSVLVAERMEKFLRAYEAVSPLNETEREQLDSFFLASAMLKMLIMLQNDLYFSYKTNVSRMRALQDFCKNLLKTAAGCS